MHLYKHISYCTGLRIDMCFLLVVDTNHPTICITVTTQLCHITHSLLAKKVGYNLDGMRQSACLVVNPITVYTSYVFPL